MTPAAEEALLIGAELAADLLLSLVGNDEEKAGQLVSRAAARRANALADAAERTKFGL